MIRPIIPGAQAPSGCTVNGSVTASRQPLPGVVVTLHDGQGRTLDTSSSGADGAFVVNAPSSGSFTLSALLVAFAPISQEIAIDSATCAQRVDLTMTLASRAAQATPAEGREAARPPLAARGVGGRGQAAAAAGRQPFQSLALVADPSGARANPETATGTAEALLPPGFSIAASADSVTAFGNTQATAGYFGPNGPGDFAERFGFGNGFGDAASNEPAVRVREVALPPAAARAGSADGGSAPEARAVRSVAAAAAIRFAAPSFRASTRRRWIPRRTH